MHAGALPAEAQIAGESAFSGEISEHDTPVAETRLSLDLIVQGKEQVKHVLVSTGVLCTCSMMHDHVHEHDSYAILPVRTNGREPMRDPQHRVFTRSF